MTQKDLLEKFTNTCLLYYEDLGVNKIEAVRQCGKLKVMLEGDISKYIAEVIGEDAKISDETCEKIVNEIIRHQRLRAGI